MINVSLVIGPKGKLTLYEADIYYRHIQVKGDVPVNEYAKGRFQEVKHISSRGAKTLRKYQKLSRLEPHRARDIPLLGRKSVTSQE